MYEWHSVLLSCFIVVQCMYHSHYSLTYFYLRNVQCGHIFSTIIASAYMAIKRNENHYAFKYVTTIFYLKVSLTTLIFKKPFGGYLRLYVNVLGSILISCMYICMTCHAFALFSLLVLAHSSYNLIYKSRKGF